MYLFRIHIRPQGGSADMRTTFDYCLKHNLLGVGWRTESRRATRDWDEFYREASSMYTNLNVVKYIQKWVSEGDLVWTRNPDGQYYLARALSGWEYWTCDEAEQKDIDIANIFRCDLKRVDIDDVPGKVVACFRATRTIQEVANEPAREYSKYLWNLLSGSETYPVDASKYHDPFLMFDDEETEDVLFLYLQSQGWYVLPNSRKGDTMSFEYLVVNPKTGEKAVTQVKTGNSAINLDDYKDLETKLFAFHPNDIYLGDRSSPVVRVSRHEVLTFLASSTDWLPKALARKLALAGTLAAG